MMDVAIVTTMRGCGTFLYYKVVSKGSLLWVLLTIPTKYDQGDLLAGLIR